MIIEQRADFIESGVVESILTARAVPSASRVRELLAKARELEGLTMEEVASLTFVDSPELLDEIFCSARQIKEEIYGSRLVFFAPLYVSNRCSNECTYCAFRATNTELKRRTLTLEEIAEETRILIRQGHKRVLVVAGEALPPRGFDYILDAINTIYETRVGPGEIRRINVNLAPQTVERFRQLKPIIVPPTPPSTCAARSAITTGARRRSIAPWKLASTTLAWAYCSACTTGGSKCSR
jgi:2-iminoacetate synthase